MKLKTLSCEFKMKLYENRTIYHKYRNLVSAHQKIIIFKGAHHN